MTPSIARILADQIGLDPSTVGEALIDRGVRARMLATGSTDVATYERSLSTSAEELQALVEEVVIPETWFFRDARPFDLLRRVAQDGWAANPARAMMRCLSVPCASGEEPYSIAMTLLDVGLPGDRFRVDAVDVSARSVARAIAGVYGANSFRAGRLDAMSAYFREHNGRFSVEPQARSVVRFHLGNLLDGGLFEGGELFDVVFCRNLLIYLDGPAKVRAFATLGRLIVDGGLLFLGHADRPDDSPESPFTAIAEKGSFAYRKGSPAPGFAGKFPGLQESATSAVTPGGATGSQAASKPRATAKPGLRLSPKTPATLPLVAVPKVPDESPASMLDRASALADSGRYHEATELAGRAIEIGPATAGAFFLLGLICQASGDRSTAERHFLKAIYLDPRHEEALRALTMLARRKGDVAAEAAYRRRADRVVSRKESP